MRTPTNLGNAGKRLVAAIIDGIIVGIGSSIVLGLFMAPMISKLSVTTNMESIANETEFVRAMAGTMGSAILAMLLISFFYYVLQHKSKHQATFGKRAMDLYVTDMEGQQLTFGKAAIRFLGRIVNSFTMSIGYILILLTEKKQGLHDMIAGTVVLDGLKKQDVDNDEFDLV
jgi:uncharacterized RDD family membrane protein YckC